MANLRHVSGNGEFPYGFPFAFPKYEDTRTIGEVSGDDDIKYRTVQHKDTVFEYTFPFVLPTETNLRTVEEV